VVVLVLLVLAAELTGLLAAAPAGAQEVGAPVTVDGPGPCRRIGGDWLEPGYCELTAPLVVGPDDHLVLAVGAFVLGPVEVEGRLEVRGGTSLVFFFGELVVRGLLAVTDGGVAYVAGGAESPGGVGLSGGGRMEILSDGGSVRTTGRFDVAADGRLDVYGVFDNQGDLTNLGVLAVWCSGVLSGSAPREVAAQVQDCQPPEMSLVSRTPTDRTGWNRGSVTVVWACVDQGSGVVAERVTVVIGGDGAGQSAFGVCTDLAGNTATAVVTGINIERPAPRTRRQPTPPVVVHLPPAAAPPAPPAPPAPSPTVPALPSPTAPGSAPPAGSPGAASPTGIPDALLPGPSITDPVSSPDPAPPAPDTTAAPPATSAVVPAPSAPTAPAVTAPSTAATAAPSTAGSVPPPASGATVTAPSSPTVTAPAAGSAPPAAASTVLATPSDPAPTATAGSSTSSVAPAVTGAMVGAATTTTQAITSIASPPASGTGGGGPPG